MIEEIIPGNKTRLNIMKTIYENPNINITNIIKKVKASPNLVLSYINKLSHNKIISEEKQSGTKKVHVRNLRANLNNDLSRTIYSLIEIEKKELFFKKYPRFKSIFEQLTIELPHIEFILIYGSFARFSSEKDSDIDVLIVGDLKNTELDRVNEIFITSENEPSIKIESKSKYLNNLQKSLYQNILKEHILISNTNNFLKISYNN